MDVLTSRQVKHSTCTEAETRNFAALTNSELLLCVNNSHSDFSPQTAASEKPNRCHFYVQTSSLTPTLPLPLDKRRKSNKSALQQKQRSVGPLIKKPGPQGSNRDRLQQQNFCFGEEVREGGRAGGCCRSDVVEEPLLLNYGLLVKSLYELMCFHAFLRVIRTKLFHFRGV